MRLFRYPNVLFLGVLGWAALAAPAAAPAAHDPAEPPYGIDQRVPWTHSHVVGSPNPPPPFQAVRAFPKLTFNQPLYVKHGTGHR